MQVKGKLVSIFMSSLEREYLFSKCKQEVSLDDDISMCPHCTYVALKKDCSVSINAMIAFLTEDSVKV